MKKLLFHILLLPFWGYAQDYQLWYNAPAEKWTERRAVRVDVIYSVLNRIGIIPLAVFLLLAPAFMELESWLRFHNFIPRQLEDWLPGRFLWSIVSTNTLSSPDIQLLRVSIVEIVDTLSVSTRCTNNISSHNGNI